MPGGGSKSNVPVLKFTFEIVPPAGVVALMLPLVTVKVVDTQPFTPLSALSFTLPSKPVIPMTFMLAWAVRPVGATTTGGSFTALTVMVNVWSAERFTLGATLLPSSTACYVISAVPFGLG